MSTRAGTPMIRRHSSLTVGTHATVGLLVIVVAVTGLGLLGVLPTPLLRAFGGHAGVRAWHYWTGIALTCVFVVIPIAAPQQAWQFVRDVSRYRVSDLAWLLNFMRFSVAQARRPVPAHAGRFDPVQRAIFALMTIALAVLAVTGVALPLIPPSARALVGACVRIHDATGWAFIGLLGLHIVAGSGVLPTHRGVALAMATGRVSLRVAQRLWPGWTARQPDEHAPRSD
ncbi:hypothetical protein EPN52_06640 [bacterium]|nr:MAG: hypothetical protein EPN52_06640 [bacterium]